VLIALASLALAQLARMQLGKSFSVTPKAKDLVTHGLYARLQNPMYLFLDVAICGIALAVHHWWVLLLLVVLVPLQIRNSRKERDLLHAKFGEQFEIYRRATWF
jgi:protein-S-isoprenylcysteine O-methyltransferase Ste14